MKTSEIVKKHKRKPVIKNGAVQLTLWLPEEMATKVKDMAFDCRTSTSGLIRAILLNQLEQEGISVSSGKEKDDPATK